MVLSHARIPIPPHPHFSILQPYSAVWKLEGEIIESNGTKMAF